MMTDETSRLAKMETTLEMMEKQIGEIAKAVSVIAQLQAEQTHLGSSMARAFGRIEADERDLRDFKDAARKEIAELSTKIQKQESRVSVYVALVTGGLFGVSALGGLITWIVSNNIMSAISTLAKVSGVK